MILQRLDALIAKHQTFCITSHVNPDGDNIGSQLAFLWYLEQAGKTVTIYNKDPVPEKFFFLTNANRMVNTLPEGPFDVLAILDSSNPDRTGWNPLQYTYKDIIDIDHHPDNSAFGTFNHIEISAAATGQVLQKLFAEKNIDYPAGVAEALYMAIMTDTGGFRFNNTSSDTLIACADLIRRGASASKIAKNIFGQQSPQGLVLKSRIWSTLQFHLDGTVCTLSMPYSLIDEIGAGYGDSEGMSDQTVIARGVKVGLLIKYRDNETHFSLRGGTGVDVAKIAKNIPGGGGHPGAAGCTVNRPYDEALALMLSLIQKELA